MNKIKIGIIGLDTSHVIAFTKLLNDPHQPYHIPGGEVIVAFPGGSPDMELSRNRVKDFTIQLREWDIQIVDSLEKVAEVADAILLESVDGRIHLEQLSKVAPYGKPIFIDKPLATTLKDAEEIFRLAKQYDTPVMSSSSLRFAEGLTYALKELEGQDSIYGADCYGPLALEPTHGLFWYGIHTVEMLYRVLGTGCKSVVVRKNNDHDLIIGEWQDGEIGTIRGNRIGNSSFGALIHSQKGIRHVDIDKDKKPFYASLLEEVIQFFNERKSTIKQEETLEVIRFIEAASKSRETGKTVHL